jgi:hypothetical protein
VHCIFPSDLSATLFFFSHTGSLTNFAMSRTSERGKRAPVRLEDEEEVLTKRLKEDIAPKSSKATSTSSSKLKPKPTPQKQRKQGTSTKKTQNGPQAVVSRINSLDCHQS